MLTSFRYSALSKFFVPQTTIKIFVSFVVLHFLYSKYLLPGPIKVQPNELSLNNSSGNQTAHPGGEPPAKNQIIHFDLFGFLFVTTLLVTYFCCVKNNNRRDERPRVAQTQQPTPQSAIQLAPQLVIQSAPQPRAVSYPQHSMHLLPPVPFRNLNDANDLDELEVLALALANDPSMMPRST